MNPLCHIVEPAGLLLTWQPQDEQAPSRTRRVVGEVRVNKDGVVAFRYLKDSPDYQKASDAGFKGYPAFDMKADEVATGVLESFLRRLPPRKREDFPEFLKLHRLASPFEYSDIALLAYTGARLPSDGFALVPIFPDNAAPCDFLLEIAGFRHVAGTDTANLEVGDPVSFVVDQSNPVDQDALAIEHNGVRIGYVNRALKDTFSKWLQCRSVTAIIERINGKPERPLVYLRVSIR
ncbi:MAG: hypothetical protein Q8O37_03465 [Sulfuricellaceae bacterium]|nr:hypothetical protein [Sulfuricellaceae bacterium]